MEETKSNAGQGLGVAGLIIGIITLLIAFIPCVGIYALVPGVIAIVLSIIALNQAKKGDGSKGLIITALVISIIGSVIALIWVLFLSSVLTHGNLWKKQLESAIGKESSNSIINSKVGSDLAKTLKDLEADSLNLKIDPNRKMTDEEFNKFLTSYDNLIQASITYHNDIKKGDMNATVAYAKISASLAQVMTKLAIAGPNLTKEQTDKIEELNKKYKKEFDEIEK